MKPPVFDYMTAASVDDAVAALAAADGEAKIIAGGQSLMPMLNFRLARPSLLIDIRRIPGLDEIRDQGDTIRIGALVRHHTLETSPLILKRVPVLSAAMAHVAHLAIRNRGTIGGSLCHADPAAELPMMAMLLGAVLTLRSPRGSRQVKAADFFLNALTTSLEADEMLLDVTIDVPRPGTGWGFEEVARRDGDFALAAAASLLRIEGGMIRAPRLALMGVGVTPIRAEAAEALLEGQAPAESLLAEAARTAVEGLEPNTDLHASSEYRRHLAHVLTKRVLRSAVSRAGGHA